MQKYFYPIFKLPEYYIRDYQKQELPRWVKWWLLGKSGRELSQILTGSEFTLLNTVARKFKIFELSGRTEQESLSGKNLFNGNFVKKYIDQTTGQPTSYEMTNYRATENYIELKANIEYIASRQDTAKGLILYYYEKNGDFILSNADSQTNIKTTRLYDRDVLLKVVLMNCTNDKDYTLQVEQGTTATSYEPYCRTEYQAQTQTFHNQLKM